MFGSTPSWICSAIFSSVSSLALLSLSTFCSWTISRPRLAISAATTAAIENINSLGT